MKVGYMPRDYFQHHASGDYWLDDYWVDFGTGIFEGDSNALDNTAQRMINLFRLFGLIGG